MYQYRATFRTGNSSPVPGKLFEVTFNIGCDVPVKVAEDLGKKFANYHNLTLESVYKVG